MSDSAERLILVQLFDAEAPSLRAHYIRTNMTRHSKKMATAMADGVINRIRQAIIDGDITPKVIDGRVAISEVELEALARKAKLERH